jgi:PKD repeat protein
VFASFAKEPTMKRSPRALLAAFSVLTALLVQAQITSPYVLVAWNDLGMHCTDGSDFSVSTILPPYNNLHAQLKDRAGNLVTNPTGITVTYQSVADPAGSTNKTSIGKTNFWTYVGVLFGATPAPDVGLAGNAMPGAQNVAQAMNWDPARSWFHAEGIPITPYDDQGHKNPYPMVRVIAKDSQGTILAQTDVVLPVSDEMDCRTCHQSGSLPAAQPPGGWVYNANQARDVKYNVLKLHDAKQAGDPTYQAALATAGFSSQGLLATVTGGRPILCQRCHATNALAGSGIPGIEPMTQAMHTFHAAVQDPVTGDTLGASSNRSACYRCHPGAVTKCLRGAMGDSIAADGSMAMQCQGCHGVMSVVGTAGRSGWLEEPSCQNCHTGTATVNSGSIIYTSAFTSSGQLRQPADATYATNPDTPSTGLNLYRFSSGHGGLQCEACHGSTHAEFPSSHPNDNVQSNQIQGHSGMLSDCSSCHTTTPSTVTGGPHGMHPVGQAWVSSHPDAAEGGASACRACHGADYRGTVLSRALGPRTLSTKYGTKTFWRGFQIGCYTCHNGPSSDSSNSNHAPAVSNASASTAGGTPVTIPLTATDQDGDTLALRVVNQPANGRAGISNTTATYYPDLGFMGSDTFTVAAWDGSTNSALATVTVNVGAPGCSLTVTTSAPTTAQAGAPAAFTAVAAPANCALSPNFEWNFGDGSAHAFAATPTHAYAAAGTYTWTLAASSGAVTATRQGTITVSGTATGPKTVPSGVTPFRITSPDHGTTLAATWDATNCSSPGYHVIYGFGSGLSSWNVNSGQCGLGTSGSASISGAPNPSSDSSRFVWFLIVGDDNATHEGSWGLTSSGQERGGSNASGVCGFTSKQTTTCATQ